LKRFIQQKRSSERKSLSEGRRKGKAPRESTYSSSQGVGLHKKSSAETEKKGSSKNAQGRGTGNAFQKDALQKSRKTDLTKMERKERNHPIPKEEGRSLVVER